MKIIWHDSKVAVRNLMKYKIQTSITILCIAIGIVTLAFTHSILKLCEQPPIVDTPYYDRTYNICFNSLIDTERVSTSSDIIKLLKTNGGLKNAEKITVSSGTFFGLPAEFHLIDSTVRKGNVTGRIIDPEYPNYSGMKSAITGKNRIIEFADLRFYY